jgi:trimeric autotransporter adhesin
MSYTILYSDPAKFNFPIIVQDDTKYNSVGTGGLTLVGRNYPGYGQAIAENFIHILENSASPVPPVNPIEGQLWFDTSDPNNKKLRINDGAANNTVWRPINGLHQQETEPTQAIVGDIWVDTAESKLYIYNNDLEFIPIINTGTFSSTGAFPETIEATNGQFYKVIVNKIDGIAVSVISSNQFTPQAAISSGITKVEVGVTLSTEDFGPVGSPRFPKFFGTAKSADSLVQGIEEVAAVKFLRKDINETINAQLRISKDTNALQIGASPTFLLSRSASGVDAIFNNEYNSFGSFIFNVKNSSGSTVPVLTMGGTGRNVIISSQTPSNSSSTGALQVAGGVGIGKDLFVSGTVYADNLIANGIPGSTGQILVTDGTKIYWDTFNESAFSTGGSSSGIFTITNVTASVSSTTGALQVTGGVGIRGNVNIGSLSTATSSTGALRVAGGISVGENLYVAGEIFSSRLTIQLTTVTTTLVETDDIIQTRNTTTSIGTTTGALIIAGGVGIGGNVNVGGIINATIDGVATSATNIVFGTAGSIVYQEAPGRTKTIGIGPADSFLRSNGTTATYATTATMYVNSALQTERFRTARTITFTGDVTGSFSLDGTQNTGTALTIQPNSIALGADTVGDYISTGTTTGYGISGSASGEGTTFNINSNATSTNDVSTVVFRNGAGSFAANNITAVQFNGSAQGLTNIPGIQIDNLSVRNSSLTSSTIGFAAGTAINVSTASVALGDSITITNTGVTSLTGSSHLAVSASAGAVTITNNGVRSISTVGAIGVNASTGTITITDVGVHSITGSSFIAVSTSTGTVTITNNGVQSLTAGTGISVSGSTGTITVGNTGITATIATTYLGITTSNGVATFTNMGVQALTGSDNIAVSTSTGTVTITNNGVRTLTGSDNIAVSTSTGTVTITNNGVRTLTGSAFIAVSTSTGTVTITNNGVQSLTGSAFLAVSQSTGTVTITNNGVQSLSVIGALGVSSTTGTITLTSLGVSSVSGSTYIGVSASTGSVAFTNLGVQTLTAGTDTSVSASTGTIIVWNNSTLQTITSRGSASSNAIQITNATQATSISTGALVVTGGVAIGGDLQIAGSAVITTSLTVTSTLTLNGATQNLGSATGNSTINLGYGATTTGNTKTVNIGTDGQGGSTTLINIGSPTAALSSATVFGDLVVAGSQYMQGWIAILPISTVTIATFTGTPTGATVYFTNLIPPKIGVYGSSAWRDALGTILF